MATACGIGYIPGMVLGAAGMALGVASVACAAIILCRKFFAFGILMIFVGLIAAGVAESACNYMVNKRGQGPPVECRKQIRIQREEGCRREAVKGQALRLWVTETIREEYMKLMDNQYVAGQCSGTLKSAAVACAVAGAVLPWLGALSGTGLIPGIALGVAGILLAVASVACAIAALCRKSVVFGIVMIFAGLVACGIAESGVMYLMFKHGEES